MIHPPKVPYTGEGFKGERLLTIASLVITIIASITLINLTKLQREHTKLQMDEYKKKNGTPTS